MRMSPHMPHVMYTCTFVQSYMSCAAQGPYDLFYIYI